MKDKFETTAPSTGIFSIRLDQDLVDSVTAQATAAGKSRNAYIATRLSSADEAETLQELEKVANGKENFALVLALAMTIASVEFATQDKWHDKPFTAEKVKDAINMLFDKFAPKGPSVVPDRLKKGLLTDDNVSQAAVFGILNQIALADEPSVKTKRDERGKTQSISREMYAAQLIKKWLGKDIIKRITEN